MFNPELFYHLLFCVLDDVRGEVFVDWIYNLL